MNMLPVYQFIVVIGGSALIGVLALVVCKLWGAG